jgi:hypothetical protein
MAAQMGYLSAFNQIEHLGDILNVPSTGSKAFSRQFRESYCLGVVSGLHNRILKDLEQEKSQANVTTLAVYNKNLVAEYERQQSLKLKTKATATRNIQESGYMQGLRDSGKVGFAKGLLA